MHPWDEPTAPMERVHIDFAGPFMNMYFLVLVDAYSRWPEIHIVKNMTAETTINVLRKIFACFGLPHVLVSDNAQTFTCYEFKKFMQENGIIQKFSAPYHPATNGLAERYVQTFKQALRALKGNDKEKELSKFLLHYRKTPHATTGVSPAYLMFNRELRTRLGLLAKPRNTLEDKSDFHPKRKFQVGERVECRDYIHGEKWEFGKIIKCLGKLHYLVNMDNGLEWRRHVNQIRGIGKDTPMVSSRRDQCSEPWEPYLFMHQDQINKDPIDNHKNQIDTDLPEDNSSTPGEVSDPEFLSCTPSIDPILRRSKRNVKPPERLNL